jgi:hypothetical protein
MQGFAGPLYKVCHSNTRRVKRGPDAAKAKLKGILKTEETSADAVRAGIMSLNLVLYRPAVMAGFSPAK